MEPTSHINIDTTKNIQGVSQYSCQHQELKFPFHSLDFICSNLSFLGANKLRHFLNFYGINLRDPMIESSPVYLALTSIELEIQFFLNTSHK